MAIRHLSFKAMNLSWYMSAPFAMLPSSMFAVTRNHGPRPGGIDVWMSGFRFGRSIFVSKFINGREAFLRQSALRRVSFSHGEQLLSKSSNCDAKELARAGPIR